MIVYAGVSLVLLSRRLKGSVRLRENIYLSDYVPTPFVIGVVRPRIYLPSSLQEKEMDYIILHERTHIRRGDHIIRMISFFALAVYWFHPLIWAAYYLSGKDMEMSCDEAVLRFWSNRSGEANEIRITELIKGSVRFGAPFPALLSLFSFLVIRKAGIPVFHNAHYGLAGVSLNFVSGVVIVFAIAACFAVNAACAASAEL